MTREDARRIFETLLLRKRVEFATEEEIEECLNTVLEALSVEPCEDAVSKQAVIEVLIRNGVHFCDMIRITSELNELPPVVPYQKTLHEKTGYWTKDSHCSCCGKMAAFHIGRCAGDTCTEIYHSDYCPKCGARMLPIDLEKERV